MGFEAASCNELPYAREVATCFETHHREGTVNPDLSDLFERLVTHFDQPFADVSLFPIYLVSQIARAHVTVALSGDGGDELFDDYDTYEAEAIAGPWLYRMWRCRCSPDSRRCCRRARRSRG